MTGQLNSFAADAVYFRSRVRYHHWNVQGRSFIQDHEYFDEVYSLLDDEVDQAAEWARTFGNEFPSELVLSETANSRFDVAIDQPQASNVSQLVWDELENVAPNESADRKWQEFGDALPWFEIWVLNQNHIDSLMRLREYADDANEIGIVNGVEDFIEEHNDIRYFVGSTLKRFD